MKRYRMRAGRTRPAGFGGLPWWLLAGVLFGGADTASAMRYHVTTTGDGSANGCTNYVTISMCTTLRSAIAGANASSEDDTITFEFQGQTITLTHGELVISNNGSLSIDGRYNTISGNDASRVFRIQSGADVTLEKMTITRGNVGTDWGGGIYNQGTLTLWRSTLSDNKASFGSAIDNFRGTLKLYISTVSGNTSIPGSSGTYGPVINIEQGSADIFRTTISHNLGGGIANRASSVSIRGSVLANSISGPDCLTLGQDPTTTSYRSLIESGAACLTQQSFPPVLTGDPKLGPLAFSHLHIKTHRPLPGSPLIGQFHPDAFGSTDQIGTLRKNWSDIGAIEVLPPLFEDGFEGE